MAQAPPPVLPPDFADFAPKAGYKVEPDGRVYTEKNGQKTYVPPWVVWQNSDVGRDPNGAGLTPEGFAYRIPGSDPNSAWHFMYSEGGPFVNRSQWDQKNGTYQGSIDWLSLITSIGAGGVIAAGIVAATAGGAAAGAGAGAGTLGGEAGVTTGLTAGALPGAIGAPAAGATTLGGIATTGPLAGGLSGATTTAAVPSSLAAVSGPGVGSNIVNGILGGKGVSSYWDLINPAINTALSLWQQDKALGANSDSLNAQIAASKYAADLQAKAQSDALAYAKQQAAQTQSNYETSQFGNYGQWAAGQHRMDFLGQEVGLPQREIPAYVKPVTVGYDGATLGGAAQSGPSDFHAPDPQQLASQITADYAKEHGGAPIPPDVLQQQIGYASKPDLYSDNQWRIGWNPYLAYRMNHGTSGADPSMAGTSGIIKGPPAAGSVPSQVYKTSVPMGTFGNTLAFSPLPPTLGELATRG